VKAKTGKGWSYWFSVLDRFDVRAHGHKSAAEHLAKDHGLSGWWAQMITVEYERMRGLRTQNQSVRGDFQVSVSRTLEVPVSVAWSALADEATLRRWWGRSAKLDLREGGDFVHGGGGRGEVRRVVPGQRIRLWWQGSSGKSVVEIRFEPRGRSRSCVVIQHSGLRQEEEMERFRRQWGEALDCLRDALA
jgi:uncharacterized protein YndB with AHSA1/START domain